MKVAIIGSGGREHSICMSLKNSSIIEEIYCIPGNAGTKLIAKNIDIAIADTAGRLPTQKHLID